MTATVVNSRQEGDVEAGHTQQEDEAVPLCKVALSCLAGSVLGVSAIAVSVSFLCFFVSGLVFTIEEFDDIPPCADPYKAWSITMVVVFYFLMQSSVKRRDSWSWPDDSTEALAAGISMLVLSIFPGLVAGLGSRDVLHHPQDECDTAASLPQLEEWTEWVVVYSWVIMGILQLSGLLFLLCSCSSS